MDERDSERGEGDLDESGQIGEKSQISRVRGVF